MESFDQKSLFETEAIYDVLEQRKQQLNFLLDKKKKELEDAPQGHLHVVRGGKNHQKVQYYHRKTPQEKTGTYIRKKDRRTAEILAQKDYDEAVVAEVQKELVSLEHLQKHSANVNFLQHFELISPERQMLIQPVFETDEQFVARWNSKSETSSFREEEKTFLTRRDEYVRSKSEVLIANTLDDFDIPYKYECSLKYEGNFWATPDFTVLNVKRRKQFYWEHFGMVDDSDYAQTMVKKLSKYAKAGILPGKNLIVTFESLTNPIRVEIIRKMIQEFLLS